MGWNRIGESVNVVELGPAFMKITKPSSNVPLVESTHSHRWIDFSGESSSSEVTRCDAVKLVSLGPLAFSS